MYPALHLPSTFLFSTFRRCPSFHILWNALVMPTTTAITFFFSWKAFSILWARYSCWSYVPWCKLVVCCWAGGSLLDISSAVSCGRFILSSCPNNREGWLVVSWFSRFSLSGGNGEYPLSSIWKFLVLPWFVDDQGELLSDFKFFYHVFGLLPFSGDFFSVLFLDGRIDYADSMTGAVFWCLGWSMISLHSDMDEYCRALRQDISGFIANIVLAVKDINKLWNLARTLNEDTVELCLWK